jgi:hypothetical protein
MSKSKYGRPRNGSGKGGLTALKVTNLLGKKWGARRIAKRFNVTRQAVYQFMRRHNIAPTGNT